MVNFGSLNKTVFHTVDTLQHFAAEVRNDPLASASHLKSVTKELVATNKTLEETIQKSQASDAARKALEGLRVDLRMAIIQKISREIFFLQNIPLLQIQVGTSQSQQSLFSRELKKFEERLQYVMKKLKKARGGQAAQVEQDSSR